MQTYWKRRGGNYRTHNFLARLEAQTCRQHGLPLIYEEILNFAGDEIYLIISKISIIRNFLRFYITLIQAQ